jgi:type 1 glutamine amidotransferase
MMMRSALQSLGAEGVEVSEPVAWTWTRKGGRRVFCTSLGHPDDFKDESFTALLRNGILWAAGATTYR